MMRYGLECHVGGSRAAVPVEAVDQVIEYSLSGPLPLGCDLVAGLGAHGDRVLVSIDLGGRLGGAAHHRSSAAPTPGRREVKGVLFGADDGALAWALEVDRVGTFVEVEVGSRAAAGGDLPWLLDAEARDGRSLAWVDVPAMLASLRGEGWGR